MFRRFYVYFHQNYSKNLGIDSLITYTKSLSALVIKLKDYILRQALIMSGDSSVHVSVFELKSGFSRQENCF